MNDASLFLVDKSHGNFYPSTELVKAVAQTHNYLNQLTADQHRISALHNLRVEKVRGKVVIGRDGDDKQLQELQKHNATLGDVEVITYDQLIRIAGRILEILVDSTRAPKSKPGMRGAQTN
jgi:hypothetical protein